METPHWWCLSAALGIWSSRHCGACKSPLPGALQAGWPLRFSLWWWTGRSTVICDTVPVSRCLCSRSRNILIADLGKFRNGRQAAERPIINYLCISSTYNMMVFKWYMTADLNSFVWIKSLKILSFWASPHLLLWKWCKPRGEKISG